MFRKWHALPLSAFLVLAGSLFAQRSFPSPFTQLHDVKFEIPEPRPDDAKIVVLDGRRFTRPASAAQVNSLAFSHDGKLLAAGKEYGRLVIWEVVKRKVVRIIDTGFGGVGLVAFSPNDQLIAAADEKGPSIKLWNIADGQLVTTVDNTHPHLLQMVYARNLLIIYYGSIDAFNTTTGKLERSFANEGGPLLSTDGNTLVTVKGQEIALRNTENWAIERTLSKLTEFEWPVFWDTNQGVFLFKDHTDDHLFVPARTSDGQMLPDVKLANLPRSWLDAGDFAAIDPATRLVLGHSAGQLWALDLKTGETCLSPQLFSDSGALSPDGSLLAGAIEPATPTDDPKQAGVGLWRTADLAKACQMK